MRGGWFHFYGGFSDNYFAQTYLLAFFFAIFIVIVLFFWLLEEQPEDDEPYSRRAWFIKMMNFIAQDDMVFRVFFSICFGFAPACAITHGWVNEEYRFWGYGLAVCYAIWLTQKIIRTLRKQNKTQ